MSTGTIKSGILIKKRRDGQISTGTDRSLPGSNASASNFLANYLEVVNPGAEDEYLLFKLPLATRYGMMIYANDGYFPPSLWDDMPYATDVIKGGIKYDPAIFEKNASDQLTVKAGVLTPAAHNHDTLYASIARVDAMEAMMSTDAERIAAINELTANYSVADTALNDTLTAALTQKAPKDNPIFSGTVQGITKAMVGLGNVTNESKATMFANPEFTGHILNGGVYRKTITLPVPGPNVGQGKWYIRLHPANVGRVMSVKVTVQGDWNYANISGWLTAECNYYAPGNGSLSQSDFRVTSTCGNAHDLLRIGAPVSEGGYISIPVWCINTNAVMATVEWFGSDDQVHSSDWMSEAMPARNRQSIRGGADIDGNTVINGTLMIYSA
jgi:hypothetical protein